MNNDTAPVHSCWNKIGVWGSRSCAELEQCVHCRHCPVYIRAAARVLDREIPADYGQVSDDGAAVTENRAAGNEASLIIFRLGDEWLALPTNGCSEVAEPGPVHTLPYRNDPIVLGIVNIRGELLICVSLARVLGIDAPGAAPDFKRFLVYGSGAQRLVFPASDVHGVCRISTDEIRSAPATVTMARNSLIRGVLAWSAHTVGVLEGEILMTSIDRRLS